MLFSKKPLVIASLIFCLLSVGIQTTQALTFTEVVNLLQSPDINLPTGVTNPKGNIGFILSNLFWGTADGTKNGKIKPEYLDYSGISAWTQSGTITYLTASTGSVGIGTPNPGEYSTAIRGIDDTATAGALWVSGQTATTPGLMVRNDGNVGIGTASPQAPLQVNGPATSGVQYAMNVIGGAAATWTDGAAIKIGPTTAGQYGSRIVSYSNAPASYGSRLQLQTHDTSATNQSFNTGLLIDENGNIGIGTASPSVYLHVKGPNIASRGQLTLEGSDFTQMTFYKDITTRSMSFYQNQADGSLVLANAINNGNISNIITGAGSFFFQGGNGLIATINGSAPANSLYINSSGNVGIGTTAPGAKLDVYDSASVSTADLLIVRDYLGGSTDKTRLIIKNGGNVGIGITTPSNPLVVDSNNASTSSIVAYSVQTNDAFSILPHSGISYLASGLYYKNAVWFHDGYGTKNALFAFGGNGAQWYASNDSAASWNVASAVPLWSAAGVLQGVSSKTSKENYESLDFRDILDRIEQLPVEKWNYKTEGKGIKHIGPYAEDFRASFGLGESDKSIALIDEAGIALAGVKGLRELVREQQIQIEELKSYNIRLEDRMKLLENK